METIALCIVLGYLVWLLVKYTVAFFGWLVLSGILVIAVLACLTVLAGVGKIILALAGAA